MVTIKNSLLYIRLILRGPLFCKTFPYNGQKIRLFQHWNNVGIRFFRMTERCLELAIANLWLAKYNDQDTYEIGAVTPYYWKSRVKNIVDPVDPHSAVTIKDSLFSLDLTNKSVLSVSTIEHIGTGDYGVSFDSNESGIKAFEKILIESKRCMITFSTGWNKELDEYFGSRKYLSLELRSNESVVVHLYERSEFDNLFQMVPIEKANKIPYGPFTARGVIIVEKQLGK